MVIVLVVLFVGLSVMVSVTGDCMICVVVIAALIFCCWLFCCLSRFVALVLWHVLWCLWFLAWLVV